VTFRDRGLLDTSTVILLDRIAVRSALPRQPCISSITLAEMTMGPLVASGPERAHRQAQLQRVEFDFVPLPFDADAARAFGRVAASLRRSGRKASARTHDAMIAAVAVANGLPLYTCNPRDFEGIEDLVVVPVEVPR
jgi:tRNA(fMet)-specific endonuclease VapC